LEPFEKPHILLDLIEGFEIIEFYTLMLKTRAFCCGQLKLLWPLSHDEYQTKGCVQAGGNA